MRSARARRTKSTATRAPKRSAMVRSRARLASRLPMPRSAPLLTEMMPGTVVRSKPYQAATA